MIVAVTGGKGGVGKTTVALNLARELDAVVVDADLTTPDLPRSGGPDLHDLLAGRAKPREALTQIGSVRVLSAGRTLAGTRAAKLTAFPEIVDRVERRCGHVVVDCPAGLARDVGIALDSAHVAVLVTTPTEPAVVDALRTRQLALELETPIAAVVLNRTSTIDTERFDRNFAAPTIAIDELSTVVEAQRQWRPVRDVDPTCSAVENFETIARSVERCEQRRSRHR
ncbi:MinD/ParA family ATP-binding protein [Natronorubrum sulfidifaciens]|uniref:Cobyrinic acid ac-diamide synthase n=1 Tax=Natronorubrum sulfidifaciens JCM 14089 TaxID=1230460 RepID=L9WJ60_9EURY|nr:P-loop NTPase [Natronorubrum sulfidifaciens]ELY49422.1 cobyrinic acid ac-diamide synthase [Natronorubrum sulfidifaciens JCM 14089]